MKYLDSIIITKTYAGCLEGVPSVDSCIQSAKNTSNKMFGDRPIVVLDFETKIVGKDFKGNDQFMLPQWQHIAWISSFDPIKDGDGSHVVAIWFSDNPSCDLIPIIDKINWNQDAKDWWI